MDEDLAEVKVNDPDKKVIELHSLPNRASPWQHSSRIF